MDSVEISIIEALEDVSVKLIASETKNDNAWTRAIKNQLTELAYETYDYNVWTSPNDFDDTTSEYLYDMVWYEHLDGHINDINLVHLVLESEWKRDFSEIKYDFYKLTQARAKYRVMIFQSNDIQSVFDNLCNIVDTSRMTEVGDRYLLAGWNDYEGFRFSLKVKE
jgi:hypothetical protein